jgi:hypothetical protein
MACVDQEDTPVWKEEWFWGAMSCVGGAMALGLSKAYKKNTEAKDKAREDPDVQTSEREDPTLQIPEQGVVIAKTSNKLIL